MRMYARDLHMPMHVCMYLRMPVVCACRVCNASVYVPRANDMNTDACVH